MSDECLGLFAKYWQPGGVKTRLAKAIGKDRAAAASRLFLRTSIERLGDFSQQKWLVYAPRDQATEFETLLHGDWQMESQGAGDLGLRMQAFVANRLDEGCRKVVLLGSDSPHVPLEYIQHAFVELRSHEIVLGPTEDGGYWLLGLAERVPEVFQGIAWSTPRVWSQTLAAIRSAGLSHAVLPCWYDVDEPRDLQRLIDVMRQEAGRDPALDRLLKSLNDEGCTL